MNCKLEKLLVLLVVLWSVASPVLTDKICKEALQQCSGCGTKATCETLDKLVPSNLPSSVENLTISYTGKPIKLTRQDLSRYTSVTHLKIFGPVSSIDPQSFTDLVDLRYLEISGGSFTTLPANPFAEDNVLQTLILSNNNLTSLPVHMFEYLPNVETLDVSFNSISLCPSDQHGIAEEFKHLTSLRRLNLATLKIEDECMDNVTDNMFRHTASLKSLNLSETNIFVKYSEATFLKNLRFLEELVINNVEPFKNCPSHAKVLFDHMPHELTKLTARRWRSVFPMTQLCQVTNDTIAGLKSLAKLEDLDFKYSDLMFGHEIEPSLFHGFNQLLELDIGWCRISVIQKSAFEHCPKLETLYLNGNPLGPRRLQINGVKKLNLQRTKLASDGSLIYDASQLLMNSPNLTSIDFSRNFLHVLPEFVKTPTILNSADAEEFNVTYSVEVISLNNNFINNFYSWNVESEGNEIFPCSAFPRLHTISVKENRLRDITGLCPSVKNLFLSNNELYRKQDRNLNAIQELVELEVLDLANNSISRLNANTFSKLTNLKEIYLDSNKLRELPTSIFSRNLKLQVISLQRNKLSVLDTNIVSRLPALRVVRLRFNSFQTFPEEFIEAIQSSKTLEELDITGNSLQCPCGTLYFQEFIKTTDIVPDGQSLVCRSPSYHENMTVYLYKEDVWFCKVRDPVIYTTVSLSVLLVALLVALPCYKYRWYLRHLRILMRAVSDQLRQMKMDDKCEYDAYVSYDRDSEEDSEWVINYLVPTVEGADSSEEITNLKLYIEERDATVGGLRYSERCKALEQSRKILIIVSNSYLKSDVCLGEADLAGYELFGSQVYRPNRILLLVREELDEQLIRTPISVLLLQSVLMVKNSQQSNKARQKVKQFLSKSKLTYRKRDRTRRREIERRVDLSEI